MLLENSGDGGVCVNAKTEARKESQFHLSSHSHRQTRGGEIYLRKCELNSTLGKKNIFLRAFCGTVILPRIFVGRGG